MVHKKFIEAFSKWGYDILKYQGSLCVPIISDLSEHIFLEIHSSRYFIHLIVTKMYRDLREIYWWNGICHDPKYTLQDRESFKSPHGVFYLSEVLHNPLDIIHCIYVYEM